MDCGVAWHIKPDTVLVEIGQEGTVRTHNKKLKCNWWAMRVSVDANINAIREKFSATKFGFPPFKEVWRRVRKDEEEKSSILSYLSRQLLAN
jgi:hypothetical protein